MTIPDIRPESSRETNCCANDTGRGDVKKQRSNLNANAIFQTAPAIAATFRNREVVLNKSPESKSNRIAELYKITKGRNARLIARATLAYFDSEGYRSIPSEPFTYVWHDLATGFDYVVLGAAKGELLAIYRVDSRQKLKRLVRAPSEIFAEHIGMDGPIANLWRGRSELVATMQDLVARDIVLRPLSRAREAA